MLDCSSAKGNFGHREDQDRFFNFKKRQRKHLSQSVVILLPGVSLFGSNKFYKISLQKTGGEEEKVITRIGRISGRIDLVVLRYWTGIRQGHNWGVKPSECPITGHLWSSLENQSCSMPRMHRQPQCHGVYPRLK